MSEISGQRTADRTQRKIMNAAERLEKINKALDNYEKTISVIPIEYNKEVESYLTMNVAKIQSLKAEECGIASILLAQYEWHLQKAANVELANINWCDAELKRTIHKNSIEIIPYTGVDERKYRAIENDEYAKKLEQLQSQSRARSDRLGYLATKVAAIREAVKELGITKRELARGE
jgi:hypothetical protein